MDRRSEPINKNVIRIAWFEPIYDYLRMRRYLGDKNTISMKIIAPQEVLKEANRLCIKVDYGTRKKRNKDVRI